MNVNFGQALEALKEGKKVARSGWNGKGMWLKLVNPSHYPDGMNSAYIGFEGMSYELLSWIGMKTADNKFVPWFASQTDMLSGDWVVIEQDEKTLNIMGTELKDIDADLKQAVFNFLKINGYLPTKIEVDKNTYTKVLYQAFKALDFTSTPPTFPLSKTIIFMDIPIVEMD